MTKLGSLGLFFTLPLIRYETNILIAIVKSSLQLYFRCLMVDDASILTFLGEMSYRVRLP